MTEWQPIETAPEEDEKEILGWDGMSMVVVYVGWRDQSGKRVYFNGNTSWDITHWMPLPEPPRD